MNKTRLLQKQKTISVGKELPEGGIHQHPGPMAEIQGDTKMQEFDVTTNSRSCVTCWKQKGKNLMLQPLELTQSLYS